MFKNVLKSSAIGVAAKIVSGVGSFLIIPLMLKQLGSEHFGVWMTISSAIGLISFMDLGIGNNLINQLAKFNVINDRKSINNLISIAYLIQFGITCILILILLFFFQFINWDFLLNIKSGSFSGVIFFASLFFILNLFTNTIYSVQRGLQKNSYANKWILLNSIMYLIIIYGVLVFTPIYV